MGVAKLLLMRKLLLSAKIRFVGAVEGSRTVGHLTGSVTKVKENKVLEQSASKSFGGEELTGFSN